MPKDVATAMLCDPKARMTNPMRKAWMGVREEHFVSEEKRKPIEDKLAERWHDRPIDRVSREVKRVGKRRAKLQAKYEVIVRALMNAPGHPVLRAQQAKIDLMVAHLDLVTDALATELQWRAKLVKGDIAPNTVLGSAPLRRCFEWNGRWVRTKPETMPILLSR